MDELVKRIDPHFAYEWHEIEDGIMRVYGRSMRKDAQCPYVGVYQDWNHGHCSVRLKLVQ